MRKLQGSYPVVSVLAWSVSALVLLFLGSGTAQAGAETLTVDTTNNANISTCSPAPNDCTLQGAINRTNADSSADTINFTR